MALWNFDVFLVRIWVIIDAINNALIHSPSGELSLVLILKNKNYLTDMEFM